MQIPEPTDLSAHEREVADPRAELSPDDATSSRSLRRRPRTSGSRRLQPRLTSQERAEIDGAAASVGLTTSRFCVDAALAAARGEPMVLWAAQDREALARLQRQLFAARTEVGRFGTNVNQAVAALNATGEAPVWMERALALVGRSIGRLDEVIAKVDMRLR